MLILIEIPLVLITLLRRSDKILPVFSAVLILILLVGLFARDRAVERNFNADTDFGSISELIRDNCDGCVVVGFLATSYSAMIYSTASVPINIGYTEPKPPQEYMQIALDNTVIIIKDRPAAWSNLPNQLESVNSLINDYDCPKHEFDRADVYVCVLK